MNRASLDRQPQPGPDRKLADPIAGMPHRLITGQAGEKGDALASPDTSGSHQPVMETPYWTHEGAAMTPRTALVTGGAGGLGSAAAERLRAEGIKVTTVDLTGADIDVDVTNEEALRRVAAEVGGVDVLVNSAGVVGPNKPLLETTADEWRGVLDVNVLGTVNAIRAFVPGMRDRGWGRVVNFASMAGKDGNPNLSVYSASKAAVIGLTKSVGKELATSGVLVNVIAPAVIATPMNDKTAPDVLAHITSLIPMRRVGRPEEVAELVAFLASDRVGFSTGAVYDISGGRATY